MAKCPKCGKEIEYLINVETGLGIYMYDGQGYEFEDFEADGSLNCFECPECGEIVAQTNEEADEILKEVRKMNKDIIVQNLKRIEVKGWKYYEKVGPTGEFRSYFNNDFFGVSVYDTREYGWSVEVRIFYLNESKSYIQALERNLKDLNTAIRRAKYWMKFINKNKAKLIW